MRTIKTSFAFLSLVLLVQAASAQSTILFEDFEDSTVSYTTSVPDDLTDISNRDYFGRIDATSGLPTDVSYDNAQGSGFYGVQDTDGTNSGNIDVVSVNFLGIGVANVTDLELSFFVAEDSAGDGNEDWDLTTSFRAQAQIDGGGFVDIFAIESSDPIVGNRAPRQDTNFDGLGDGVAITDVFTQFTFALDDFGIGTGNSLDIQFTFEDLDTGDEDLAFDSVRLTGTNTVPEPSATTLLLLFGATSFLRRTR